MSTNTLHKRDDDDDNNNNNNSVFYVQVLIHLPYNILDVSSNLCQGNDIFLYLYIETSVWFFFKPKLCKVWWWPEYKAETSNYCKLLMVLLHDSVFNTYVQGYYKRNRHFQRYVVSKPLA